MRLLLPEAGAVEEVGGGSEPGGPATTPSKKGPVHVLTYEVFTLARLTPGMPADTHPPLLAEPWPRVTTATGVVVQPASVYTVSTIPPEAAELLLHRILAAPADAPPVLAQTPTLQMVYE